MALTPVVTCCDERYLPGLEALHNSFLRHSAEGFEFHAIITGSDEFADHLRNDLGIGVFRDVPFPAAKLPGSRRYSGDLSLFYARLLVPSLFPDRRRSVYIDTDSLILRSLRPLVDRDLGGHPVAATRSNSPHLGREIVGGREDAYGPMSSLYVFDHAAWFGKRVLERCAAAMESEPVEFITIAQAVLAYVLDGDWLELPWETQAHAGHTTWQDYPRERIYTLHFMGTNPWEAFRPGVTVTPLKLELRELWQTYASRS